MSRRTWDDEDDAHLRKLYVKHRLDITVIAERTGRSYDGIKSRIDKLGLVAERSSQLQA